MTSVITQLLRTFIDFRGESRRINKDLKGAEEHKDTPPRRHPSTRAGNPFEIIDTGETGSVPSFSSACNSLPFSRSAPPINHKDGLVLSHRYNESLLCIGNALSGSHLAARYSVTSSRLQARRNIPDVKHESE